MIQFQSFFSSSSGNSTFISDGTTNILVDCGARAKQIEACLERIDALPASISAIFVTHEHRDHTSGVGVFSRKYNIPIYASGGTWEAMEQIVGKINEENKVTIVENEEIKIGNIKVKAFLLPHDAVCAFGYKFYNEYNSVAIATDTGYISDELFENLKGTESVIIEANHDVDMLRGGKYPIYLKRRILSQKGHLSNGDCARLCAMLAKSGTKALWLGHLSQENNAPMLAYTTVKSFLEEEGIAVGTDISLNVLPKEWK